VDYLLLSDELALVAILVVTLLIDFCTARKRITGLFATAATAALLGYVFFHEQTGSLFSGAYVYDGISWFSKITILAGTVLTALLSLDTIRVKEKYTGAYYALLLSSALGMMFLVSSQELITLYVALETTAISLYALAAIYKKDDFSLEAGIKYLILGALSSGILLYGISILYATTASTSLSVIVQYTAQNPLSPFYICGIVLVLIGVGFKLSMVPFHVWTPDVYQGAPTPVTAYISVASKAAGFILALRLFGFALAPAQAFWTPIMAVLAFLTMTVGNLLAIPQKNIKRLLAYSTISQAGYLLVGFVAVSADGASSVLFYLLVYTFTNIAAFGVVIAFSRVTGSDNLEDYAGLAQKEPLLALTLLLALLSLAGIPPMAGFIGKFYLFYAAMEKGYLWLVIAGALNSTISLYYYLLILKQMYIFDRTKEYPKITLPWTVKLALVASVIMIFILGIFPGPVIETALAISRNLF
jgi:NADH-quinone oxidoreductase subunit N